MAFVVPSAAPAPRTTPLGRFQCIRSKHSEETKIQPALPPARDFVLCKKIHLPIHKPCPYLYFRRRFFSHLARCVAKFIPGPAAGCCFVVTHEANFGQKALNLDIQGGRREGDREELGGGRSPAAAAPRERDRETDPAASGGKSAPFFWVTFWEHTRDWHVESGGKRSCRADFWGGQGRGSPAQWFRCVCCVFPPWLGDRDERTVFFF